MEIATITTFPLRLTEELKAIATAQAARAGVSLHQYIATVLAAHVGAQAEAERIFAARAARATPPAVRRVQRVMIAWRQQAPACASALLAVMAGRVICARLCQRPRSAAWCRALSLRSSSRRGRLPKRCPDLLRTFAVTAVFAGDDLGLSYQKSFIPD
jgi:hypothetical protein